MKHFIDLHMHSCYSDDGEFTPLQLVQLAKEAGISIMAIADHNSVKSIDEELEACATEGITCIPAIEIDCTYQGINLHVLGYGMNYKHPEIIALEKHVYDQELSCSGKKLALTNELGFDITADDLNTLSSNGVWSGEMFAEVLLRDERYMQHPLLLPYRSGNARGDNPFVNFYWDFYAQGKPCYTEIKYPSMEDTIALIHKHGGIAVLAHPGNNLKDRFELFDEMVSYGLDGVEAHSSYHTLDVQDYFCKKGKEHHVLITSGSDFHGKTKPSIHMGEPENNDDQKALKQQLFDLNLL